MNLIQGTRKHENLGRLDFCKIFGMSLQVLDRWEDDESGVFIPSVVVKSIRLFFQYGLFRYDLGHIPSDYRARKSIKLKYPEKFPEQMQQLRANTGLSREKFAAKYGVSAEAVKAWEHGRRTPPGYVAYMLMRIINEHDAAFAPEPVDIEFEV